MGLTLVLQKRNSPHLLTPALRTCKQLLSRGTLGNRLHPLLSQSRLNEALHKSEARSDFALRCSWFGFRLLAGGD